MPIEILDGSHWMKALVITNRELVTVISHALYRRLVSNRTKSKSETQSVFFAMIILWLLRQNPVDPQLGL